MTKRKSGNQVRKRTVLKKQYRQILCRFVRYFMARGSSKTVAVDQTAEVSGVSVKTVYVVLREEVNGQLRRPTPGKGRIPQACRQSVVDDTSSGLLRRMYVDLCLQKNHDVTLVLLTSKFRSRTNWKGSLKSMYRLLRKLGFRFRRLRDICHAVLTERNDIVAMRINYLREMMQIQSVPKEKQKQVIWLDKTYIDRINRGKRERFIFLNAGMSSGLVKNAATVFSAKDADHQNVTAVAFRNWFVERLLPNIPPNTVIVMDSTNVPSVQLDKVPSSEWKKEHIREWLDEHEITSTAQTTRAELLATVSRLKPRKKKYEIDKIAEKNGHTTLRLPPYHYDLNPVRLIWTYLKKNVDHHIKESNSVQDIQQLVDETLGNVNSDLWKETVAETMKALEHYYLAIQPMDEREDEIITHIAESSEDDSTSDSD